ncbi:Hypp5150 [Branchiostoma lanceolatum]|uniref:1-alkyl-2-acetylglycerophosphocholine esterase n=1 Tax=Branchiostoma lanceolatum TaxID=7740 RepID=A0A8K0EYD3_BRALA|nr:Hypp5150 [Branchiostoma lanceolatum]
MKEENSKLRNRVKHLEELVTSLRTETTAIRSDLSAVNTSHDTLKVKVSNMRLTMLDNAMTNNSPDSPDQTALMRYAVTTSNRFEPLQATPSAPSHSDDELETNPKALIQPLTNSRKPNNPRSPRSKSNSKSKRVVVLGDSNAQKLKPDRLSPTADIPKPTWAPTLTTTISALEKLSEEEPTPNTVVLHVGTNDVVSKSKETVVNEFETVISTTQSLFPLADVVVSAVPPRRDTNQRPKVNEDILYVNEHLKNICEANTTLTFVDHPKLWLGRDHNEKMFTSDGYHLSGDGVRVMAYNLKKQATGLLGLQPTKQGQHRRVGNQGRARYNNDWRSSTSIPRAAPPPNRERQTTPGQGYDRPNYPMPRPTQYLPTPPPFPGPDRRAMGPFHPPPVQWNSEWPSVMEAYGDSYRYNLNPIWAGPPLFPPYNRGWIETYSGPGGRSRNFK